MDRIAKLVELTLPEYRDRHVFVTKLRLAIFIAFWALYFYFLRDVLDQTKWITLIVCATFILTSFAYYNVMKNRWLIFSFLLEMFADLSAITTIVYLTGGPYSQYFTIYIFYCFAAGLFYNHLLAAFVSFFSLVVYGIFILLCWWAVIPPLILNYGDRLPIPAYTPLTHFFFAAAFLFLTVYAIKIAQFFLEKRERMLESRNKELTALHKMGSTIRSAISLEKVIKQILVAVLEGLNFEAVVLLAFDRANDKIRFHSPHRHPMVGRIEEILGRSLNEVELSLSGVNSPVLDSIKKHQIVFRRDLVEGLSGLEGAITREQARYIQKLLGIKRVIAIPLIAEEEVLGALVGLSTEPFVEERLVQTLESFANSASLLIEASTLIERLKKTNEQLKEANRVKSEFLAVMSHELRTPLTAIIGFSELLLEGVMGDLTTEQKESLSEVIANGADLLDLINSLLDLAKIESGKMKFEPRPFDLKEMLERISRMIASLIQRKGLKLSRFVASDLPTIVGDERKIQQVLLNLISNAIKFTPEGGEIKISAGFFNSEDEIKKSAWASRAASKITTCNRGMFIMSVKDTGTGIPHQYLESVFEVFQQVDASITRSYGGTGLGLALAKQYVELHGGSIWVESEYGKGAEFFMALPNA